MKFKTLKSITISCIFLIATIGICKSLKKDTGTDTPSTEAESQTCLCTANETKENEFSTNEPDFMLGLWVTFMDLDVHTEKETKLAFEKKFDEIINTAKNHKINTLFVHVRSHGDAMYRSKIFPWSHTLTGVQGLDPGFDPLEYMVRKSHENGIKIHAWINPLRVCTKYSPQTISENNPCKTEMYRDKLIDFSGEKIYDPKYPETRKLITDGIAEIVENYGVDGIDFDDYFYPQEYNLSEWQRNERENSVDALIKESYQTIKRINPNVLFGVSPPGVLDKCITIGANPRKWLECGDYADYICPQIYWSTDFDVMPFKRTLDEWLRINKSPKTKLIPCLALYKIGTDADKGTWKNNTNVIADEFEMSLKNNSDGIILYSYGALKKVENSNEIKNLDEKIKSAHCNK